MKFNKQILNHELTYIKDLNAEYILGKIIKEIKEINLDKSNIKTLIIIGGYGRKEGGVIFDKKRNGLPHNNLDLLFILKKTASIDNWNKEIQLIAARNNFGIDVSAISENKLVNLEGTILGYDMRHGHQVIFGQRFYPRRSSDSNFRLDGITNRDAISLLVNRGVLMLINKLLLNKIDHGDGGLSLDEKKLIVKHTIKAIIGYGDSYLFFNNKYHWSYAQKQKNMKTLNGKFDEKIKELYNDAIEFRFKPDYEKYINSDLVKWNKDVLTELERIHLKINELQGFTTSKNKPWNIIDNINNHKVSGLRGILKGLLFSVKRISVLSDLTSTKTKLKFITISGKDMMSIIYPNIAYKSNLSAREIRILGNILKTNSDFLKTYLGLWGEFGDTNFINLLKKHNLLSKRSQNNKKEA